MASDLVLLGIVTGAMAVTLLVSRPDRLQLAWERRLPRVFPSDLSAAMESIALAHPVRFALLMFLLFLGISGLALPVGARIGAVGLYGTALLVSGFALYTARASGRARREEGRLPAAQC